jgi:hypothetical protein
MGIAGNIYQVKVHQRLLSQDLMNVFYYEQVTAAGDATELAETVDNEIVDLMLPIQVDDLEHFGVEVINLDDLTDFFTLNVNKFGSTGATESLPSFVAYAFRLNRTTRETRNGAKRIAGVPEGAVNGNTVVAPFVAPAVTLANAMGAELTAAVTLNRYKPVIHRRGSATLPDATNDVASCTFLGVSTQNSRKA